MGEIAPGKYADVLVLKRPADSPTGGMPDSPYRNLIDATERDVHLVLVGGDPVAGDPGVMRSLRGPEIQLVPQCGRTLRQGACLQPLRHRAAARAAIGLRRAHAQ